MNNVFELNKIMNIIIHSLNRYVNLSKFKKFKKYKINTYAALYIFWFKGELLIMNFVLN